MSQYPVSRVCPRCGSTTSSRLQDFSPVRVCHDCGTRYTRATPLWEGSIFAIIFLIGAVLFGLIALGLGVLMLQEAKQGPWRVRWFLVGVGLPGFLAVLCLIQAARELTHRAKRAEEGPPEGWRDHLDGAGRVAAPAVPPGTVPPEQAESLLCRIAEEHGATGIQRRLGNYRADHLANATARFAREMREDETVLAMLDTSFLQNGKAGLIVTNRGVYSSFRRKAIWLSDIHYVSFLKPDFGDLFAVWLLGGLGVLLFGRRRLQNRLLVNDKIVYAGAKNLRGDFWIDLLTTLAGAAREARAVQGSFRSGGDSPPRVIVLETTRYRVDEPAEVRRLRNPTWREVEQSIRALDGESRPSVRLWAGEPDEGLVLDVLGGRGTYALREPGDGWVYYDPNQGEEEVEVCRGPTGYRCPAFYVCTNLNRVLEIVRHFMEGGGFD